METSWRDQVEATKRDVERVDLIAKAMTADAGVTRPGEDAWTVEDVLNVAMARGLDVLEQQYLSQGLTGTHPGPSGPVP
jgi:hypothetical protein